MRLHVVGASGSGTTTLAVGLARELALPAFDADDYYWEPTDPPFTVKRALESRVSLLRRDLDQQEAWILSGSIVNWAETIAPKFTHVIYISLPPEIRLARLFERERARFGARLEPGGDMHQQHLEFIDWARRYDAGGFDVRSKALHENWFCQLSCPIVRISGERSRDEQLADVKRALKL